ncbi:MAG: hypothetical protein KY459_12185 [Acidobacteria bacterium]|nr:hypothetical protein [Acidobacteriota bacterium]
MGTDVEFYADALARDLGIKPSDLSSTEAILEHVRQKVLRFLDEVPCENLEGLLQLVANKVGTRFERVVTTGDLNRIKAKYVDRGELGFVQLDSLLEDDSFGVTIRLRHPRPGDLPFVSVIDCRGEKAYREYFTQWHEVGHLLILTRQQRLMFRRTHEARKHPEERLVDAIAGRIGFLAPMVRPHLSLPLTLQEIDDFHERCCPQASRDATIIGVINAVNQSLVYLQARPGLKKKHQRQKNFFPEPPQLRVRNIRTNQTAKDQNLIIYENMRVPERSIISRIHEGLLQAGNATENLDWWETSSGGSQQSRPVQVDARRRGNIVEAIIIGL